MARKAERVRMAVLRVLSELDGPAGGSRIGGRLLSEGIELDPRTIRYYLNQLDESGYTRMVSRRKGREITESGRKQLLKDEGHARVGIVSARVGTLAYQMTFSSAGGGSLIVNVALVDPADMGRSARELQLVSGQGLTMGDRVIVADAGDRIGDVVIPEGYVGIGTVCSLSLNGILQKEGIPVVSRFGGLLELRERNPVRFINMIEYGGSTLDPLEIFIRADMTRVRNVALRGSGIVCASFREVPSAAVDRIKYVTRKIRRFGLGGVLALGRPDQPLLGIGVSEGHCGMLVAGGLNSVAAAKETGIRLSFYSLAGLEDYSRFVTAREIMRRFR